MRFPVFRIPPHAWTLSNTAPARSTVPGAVLSADTVSALGAVSCGEERDVITDVICKQFQVAV